MGYKSTEQSAVIYDALSEGPIEGLVDSAASIRLNGNPVMGNTALTYYSPQVTTDASYTASTKTIVDNYNPDIFTNANTAHGTREALIVGGSKRGTKCTTASGNVVVLTNTSDMTFAAGDVVNPANKMLVPYIRITGAGNNGTDYVGQITEYVNTAAVKVDVAPLTTVTNANVKIDLVDTIASFDSSTNKCVLTNGGGIDSANVIVQMSGPKRLPDQEPQYNYNNFGWAFRTGERDNPYLPTPAGVGSAARAHNVNQNLETVTGGSGGSGYPTPAQFMARTSRWKTPSTAYSASAQVLTSSAMGVANPGEVDRIKVNFGFNALISQKDEGDLGIGFAEHRIKFGYSRDGGSTYTDATVYGRQNITNTISQYHKNGRFMGYSSGVITGKTKEKFNYTVAFDTTKYQPYDAYRISVERVSPINQDENHWTQQNASALKSIENQVTDKLTYPYTAYGAVVVDAEDFTQIPKRDYEIRGLKVKVPTNYFAAEERYANNVRRSVASYTRNVETGADTTAYVDWDGNFRGDKKAFDDPNGDSIHAANYDTVYTNNPVWIFFDLLTNHRYGVGDQLDPDGDFKYIDKWGLYQVAKYCDELVPDGKGGTEPRFACNAYIAKGQDSLKTLKQFTSVMRSMMIWHNGKVTLGQNAQKGPVYAFSKSNVIDGNFGYTGTSSRFRRNQVRVTWNDPEDSYKQAVEIVEDADEIQRQGKIHSKDVTAFGCTSKAQAIRWGKWILHSERLEKEAISFETGIVGAALRPGDVISVQDADERETILTGRVTNSSASSTTVIKTDRDLTGSINGTDNFYLSIIKPEGGAYLMEETATINSTTYFKGDLVLLDETGAAIDNEQKARNCKDDAGALVQLYWSDDLRIETKAVSAYNASAITVSSAFSAAPAGDTIFNLVGEKADGSKTVGSAKEYMIVGIKEKTDKMTYDINAVQYEISKFDLIDRGYEIVELPDIMQPPKRTTDVPAPQNVSAQIMLSNDGGQGLENGDLGVSGYKCLVTWQHPTSVRTDSEGTALTDVYEHLAGYNIQHNIDGVSYGGKVADDRWVTEHVPGTNTSFEIPNIYQGDNFVIRVQTVRTDGKTSDYIQVRASFGNELFPTFTGGLIGGGLNSGVMKGGVLTTAPTINSTNGTVTLANSTYTFQPPTSVDPITVASGNTNFTVCAGFNNLANGEEGYVLYDYDANLVRGSTKVDPLHAVSLVTDDTATDGDTSAKYKFKFLARLGESNNDLTQLSGTVSMTAGNTTVTGSSTSFDSDFIIGDVVAIDTAGTTRFMSTITRISSDTSMVLAAAPSRSYSGKTVHRQALRIDSTKDTIIGKVANNAGTFAYTPYTNKQQITHSGEVAQNTIGSVAIVADSITATHIAAGEIGTAAIAAGAITEAKIAGNTITNASIAANTIHTAQLTASAIGSFSVSANEITAVEVASNAIGSLQIAANAVNGTIITGNAVGSSEIAINSVNGLIISNGAIDDAGKIGAAIISGAKLADNAINDSRIVAANTISTAEIATDSITALLIAADQITSSEIAANSITAAAVVAGTITNAEIAGNTINSAVIQAGAVGSPQIGANAITSAKIAANAVELAEIKSGAVGTASIAANAINSAKIAGNAIGTAEIAANNITAASISSTSSLNVTISAGAAGGWTINSTQIKDSASKVIIDSANQRILIAD